MTIPDFVQRIGSVEASDGKSDVPELKTQEALTYFVPEIDTKAIVTAVNKAVKTAATRLANAPDSTVHWRLNADRFVREFRDGVIVQVGGIFCYQVQVLFMGCQSLNGSEKIDKS